MSDNQYRTIQGFVFQGPYERDAQGKTVRDYYVSGYVAGGEDEVVRVTVWPSHADVEINTGDYLIVNGRYEANMIPDKTGEKTMRRNVSANKLKNLGGGLGDNTPANVAPKAKRVAKTDIDF